MSELQVPQAEIVFPEHYGFCEGVVAADNLLRMVAIEAQEHGISHVYGYHEVVHNDDVVSAHEARGVIFVDDIEQIPSESIVVTSAHGVGPNVKFALEAQGSLVFDAACPLVLHTHRGVERARQAEEKVIYICHGKPGEVDKLHDEVLGMTGHLDFVVRDDQLVYDPVERTFVELGEDPSSLTDLITAKARYRIVSQTTLNSDEAFAYRDYLRGYIESIQPEADVSWSKPGDVCLAVRNRQQGVHELIELNPRMVVVVTDPKSKNGSGYVALAKELVEQRKMQTDVVAVANANQAKALNPVDGKVGLTASASTPDQTLFEVAQELGLEKMPDDIERKSFRLRDAQEGYIGRQIGLFVGRVGLRSELAS